LYSPINAYIGLAMSAELTAGQTRQQILEALGVADLAALRQQISALWETAYRDNGNEVCTLANALWLDKSLSYSQAVMDVLARDYYVSVYRQNLSGRQVTKDIQAWLNNNTAGFLRDSVESIQLPEEAVLALYSTIYFQSKWHEEFSAAKNTNDTFHAPGEDITCTFMHQKLRQMHYYWGKDYGAVSLGLKNGSSMWFILPDEGKTIDDILSSDEYLEMIISPYDGWENTKYMKVNLSVPKFDIQAKQDLRSGFENMGITDLFQLGKADFSEAFDGPVFMTAANQAVRVEIDEQGVKAAAYIEFPGAGAAAPPEEIIDFVLDRPFLFVISHDSIPLFAGAVNHP
jgi:serine protease inhibitor